jgi:hypothetical protein
LSETIHVEEVRRLSSLFVELFDEARFIKLLDEAPIGKLLGFMIPDLWTCIPPPISFQAKSSCAPRPPPSVRAPTTFCHVDRE